MESTTLIDDELMRELEARARRENLSLTRVLNRVIRQGLAVAEPFREAVVSLGLPQVDLRKALALSAAPILD